MSRFHQIYWAFSLSFLLFNLTAAAAKEPVLIDRIIAVVGKEPILLSELEKLEAQQEGRPVSQQGLLKELIEEKLISQNLLKLIEEKLISQNLLKMNLAVTQEEIEQTARQIMKKNDFSEAKDLLPVLLSQGFSSLQEWHQTLRKQIEKMRLMQKIRTQVQVQVLDDEVQTTYKNSSKQNQLHIYDLSFDKPAEAYQAWRKLKEIKKFIHLAHQLTQEGKAKLTESVITKGDLIESVEEQLFSLKNGEYTSVIELDNKHHIIYVEKDELSQQTPLEKLEKDLHKKKLYEEKIEETFKRYIDELKNTTFVQITPLGKNAADN